uniref:protein-serine/threonine phosphatase n=1 Tax=Arcella intermedia TaxID=1963864 RepID=A0A6B2LB75_9EUKA
MEDFSRVILNLGEQFKALPDKVIEREYGSFFGIFDGHSGAICAEYVAEHLPSCFTHNSAYPDDIKKAAEEAFSECDVKFLKEEAAPNRYCDGCTACVAILWDDQMYIINSGDSRCILAHEGKTIALSTDHSPSNPTEQERIVKHGGFVKNDRIRGKLGVARGFGAAPYKDKKTGGERFVTVQPEIKVHPITKDTEFLVIASDGVWDKLSNEEVTAMVREKLGDVKNNLKFQTTKEKFVFDLCMDIVREADARESSDNISCILVVFNHVPAKNKNEQSDLELTDVEGATPESARKKKFKILSPRKT